ncbi:calcium/proton exchanger [Russula emetica]|nr:calcium/proton exchanger [Russula emetica]
MSPASNVSPFASTATTSDEAHQLVTFSTIPDQPPDHVSPPQQDMPEPSTEPKSDIDKPRRSWNIVANFKEVCKQHKRDKPLGEAPDVRKSVIAIFKTSWLNVLLIFIPLSWIFHYVKLSNTLVFVFSFLAIVPLAKLLAFATDDLSLRFGQTLAGLLNATLGNAVELIVAIIALVKCELTVVQSSLVGSILSNLLLVLGMCFFAGGTRFSEQGFGISAVQLNSSLLTLSVIAVLLPAAFHNAVQPSDGSADPLTNQQEGNDILSISHGVAVILLFIYLCYLVFQLFSHKNLYDDHHSDVQQSVAYPSNVAKRLHITERRIPPASSSPPPTVGVIDPDQRGARSLEAGLEEEGETEELKMGMQTTIVLLIVVTVLVAITAEFLVDSIDGLTASGHISKGFVGLILLPIVGNAAEHVTAVTVSVKNKITLSLGVAVGSSIQIALFVIPFTVILGWILGKPLTLLFDPFESIVLFLSVLTVNYVVQDGKSNWLEGMILMCLYAIIAVTFWYYPVTDPAGILSTCT